MDNLSPPRSIFAAPQASPAPAKVYVRDFLREVDIKHLSSPLAAIKKLDKLEADRDGLLDLKDAGLQISVSPNLLLRGIKAYDAVLKAAAERGWPLKLREGVALRISVSSEPLELAVMEKTEPIAQVKVRPGEPSLRRAHIPSPEEIQPRLRIALLAGELQSSRLPKSDPRSKYSCNQQKYIHRAVRQFKPQRYNKHCAEWPTQGGSIRAVEPPDPERQ